MCIKAHQIHIRAEALTVSRSRSHSPRLGHITLGCSALWFGPFPISHPQTWKSQLGIRFNAETATVKQFQQDSDDFCA